MSRSTRTPVLPEDSEEIVDQVRKRYASIAQTTGCCCDPGVPVDSRQAAVRMGYSADQLEAVPEGSNLGLGCGAPLQGLELRPGETVVDLGSGGGIDAFLAARKVGPGGRVIGIDMTREMIERARNGARRAGLEQVEFRLGRLESLPVEDATVDAVTSNCVINLVPDKAAVFREIARVLKPGGRLVISDVVLARPLPPAVGRDLLAYVGCVAGAMLQQEYFDAVEAAGLRRVEVLSDRDALELFAGEVPEEARELLARTGVTREELVGRVRSLTWRAWKS